MTSLFCKAIHNIAVLYLSSLLFLGLHIGLHIKLSEKEEKRKDVNHVRSNDRLGQPLASVDQQVRTLRHHGKELDHLHQG